MTRTRSIPWLRVLIEGVVIVGSILLAFGIDAWWEGRQERIEGIEALALIHEDLVYDSSELASLRPPLARHVATTAWLQSVWGRASVPADSLGLAFRAYIFSNTAQLRGSAFSSLKDGDRLGLIRNAGLRAGLIQYYEESHVRLNQYFESHTGERVELLRSLSPYVLYPPGQNEGSVWPPARGPVPLTSPWSQIRGDNAVHNNAYSVGSLAELFVRFLDQAQGQNALLRAAIEEELAGAAQGP